MEEAGLFKGTTSGLPELGTLAYANQEITFDVLKSTAMRTCMECHTTGRNAMGTPAEALALTGKILSEISSNAMPPKSSGYKTLTECEKQIVETWIEDQAQSHKSVKIKDLSKCQDATAPPKEEKPDISKLEVTFANLQKYIIAPKCLSCHAHDTEDMETILDSIQGMHDAGVLAATAEESKIYQIILPTAKRQMPPIKSGLPRLTVEEQIFLKTWINKGAKEDTL